MSGPLLVLGFGMLTIAWFGPLPKLATNSFAAHMLMHMTVVAIAAPLLALGLAGRRCDPVRFAPKLFSPVPLSVLELVVVWLWHAPTLHHIARHSSGGLIAEQGSFIFCGILIWLSAFGGQVPRSASRTGAGIVGLLLTSMHMTLLGALLALAPRPLYANHSQVMGLTPLEDQHLGGAIMLLVGGVSYLAGGLFLTVDLLRGTRVNRKVNL